MLAKERRNKLDSFALSDPASTRSHALTAVPATRTSAIVSSKIGAPAIFTASGPASLAVSMIDTAAESSAPKLAFDAAQALVLACSALLRARDEVKPEYVCEIL